MRRLLVVLAVLWLGLGSAWVAAGNAVDVTSEDID